MENIFSCKICISDYNENDNSPYSLVCSHTVCKSCLYNIYNSNKKCPYCNENFDDKKLYDFKPNYEVITIMRELSNSYEKCSLCQRNLIIPMIFESENRVQIICEKCSKTENFKNNCKSLPDFISQIEENVREKKIDYENLSLGKFKNELIQNSLKDIKTYIIEKLDKSFQEYYEQNKVIKDDQLSLYFYDKINKISQKINQKATIAYCLNKMNNDIKNQNNVCNLIEKYKKLENNEDCELIKSLFSDSPKFKTGFINLWEKLQTSIFTFLNENLEKTPINSNNTPNTISQIIPISTNMIAPINCNNTPNTISQIIPISTNMISQSSQNLSLSEKSETDYENCVSIVGLSTLYHTKEKLETTLKLQFKCIPNIKVNEDPKYFGVLLQFKDGFLLEDFYNKKKRKLIVDNKEIEFYKKNDKSGFRYYVNYKK